MRDGQKGERRTYTVQEVARVLGIGRGTAYELVSRGVLPAVRLGRRLVIPRVAIDEMLADAGPPDSAVRKHA